MLFLISPAKKLDFDTPSPVAKPTQPQFVPQATELITELRTKSARQVAELMDLSEALAQLNVERYADWEPTFTPKTAKPAVLAFNGDVYEGLQATTLSADQLDWAQRHLVILSGLYGALRPLDLIRPYRLEMGTRLHTTRGTNLYRFWGSELASYLNERLSAHKGAAPVVINLASEEYFKAVDPKVLQARVVQCVFQDWKGGAYKVISFHAKRARGLMVRHAVVNGLTTPESLTSFDAEGYAFDAAASEPDRLVFRRKSD